MSGGGTRIYRLVEELVAGRTGVDIAGHLASRVKAHVDGQVRRLGLEGPDAYLSRLRDGERSPSLLDDLLADILVHETFFYRFRSQLEALETSIIPELLAGGSRNLRIWSAGCSQGPEPYTLAMLADRATAGTGAGFEILATDMCEAFLEEARRGTYREDKLGDLPSDLRRRYLERTSAGTYEVRGELRERIRFLGHNLLDAPPERHMSVVSCRNVLMYMGGDGRRRAIENLASSLSDTGFMLVGHSESLRDMPDLLGVDRRFALGIYRRSGVPASPHDESPAASRPGKAETRRPQPSPVKEQARTVSLIKLEGEYDADLRPEKLASLKESLGEAIDGEDDVVVEADGATVLDLSTARLVARAARLVESSGRRLTVRARRESVLRWAARHGLQVEAGPAPGEARQA